MSDKKDLMKVLFIVPYPREGPSNRYRVEQYLPYLKNAGISYTLRPFVGPQYYRILYKKGKRMLKTLYFLQSAFNRIIDIFRGLKHDVIFIHIEAFPFGPPFIEWFFFKIKKPIIFDFEDAIYLNRKGARNFFKIPGKFFKIVKMSRHIIVCNNYLKEFLLPYNPNITVIPTSIDIDRFMPKADKAMDNRKKPVIGWVGSHSTLPLLLELEDIFKRLSRSHSFTLKIIGGGRDISIDGVDIINEDWSLNREIENFQGIDIGVYPLPDNEWAKAKTPFKTVQYMSVGIPVVASNVAGNKDIIQDGQNSFLCSNDKEWVNKLSLLIEDTGLRKRLGEAGRRTVEERFSLAVNMPKFLKVIASNSA